MDWNDQVAPFDSFDGITGDRPPLPPEADIAELSPDRGTKLLLNSLPPSLSAVLSRFILFPESDFGLLDGSKVEI